MGEKKKQKQNIESESRLNILQIQKHFVNMEKEFQQKKNMEKEKNRFFLFFILFYFASCLTTQWWRGFGKRERKIVTSLSAKVHGSWRAFTFFIKIYWRWQKVLLLGPMQHIPLHWCPKDYDQTYCFLWLLCIFVPIILSFYPFLSLFLTIHPLFFLLNLITM